MEAITYYNYMIEAQTLKAEGEKEKERLGGIEKSRDA